MNDPGDFFKFGLLRALQAGTPESTVGIVWYRTDSRMSPPKQDHRRYLHVGVYRDIDSELHATLKAIEDQISAGTDRCLSLVERSDILRNATYHDELVPGGAAGVDRSEWLQRAVRALQGTDIIFADPDTGIASPSMEETRSFGSQHASLREIAALADVARTLVFYQHRNRQPWDTQRRALLERMADVRPGAAISSVLISSHGGRAFFCVSQDEHGHKLVERGLSVFRERIADLALNGRGHVTLHPLHEAQADDAPRQHATDDAPSEEMR